MLLSFASYMDDDVTYRVLLSTGTIVIGKFTSDYIGRDGFVTMIRPNDSWVDLNPAHVVVVQVNA